MSVKTQRKNNAAPVSYKVTPAKKVRRSPSKTTSKTHGKYPLSAYEHLHIGIVECSLEGKYINANEEFCRILGYSKKELLQLGVKETTHEDDYALDLKLNEQLITGKIPFYGLEKRYVRKDGGLIWAELTRSLVRDAKGKPLSTLGVVIDTSEHKQVERVLRESSENLRLAAEAARMFRWELDFQKQLYTFADNFDQVLGFSAGLLPQNSVETVWRLSPEEDVRAISEAITQAVESHSDLKSLQYRVIDPEDGRTAWLEVNAKVVYDQQGNPQRMFGVAQNITEKKRVEELERTSAASVLAVAEANAKFRAFFDQGSNFAGVMTLDGTLVEANRLCLDFCGFRREEVVGKKFWDCGWWNPSPDLMEMVRKATQQAAEGKLFRQETTYFLADGSERYVDLIITPCRDETTGQLLFLAPTGTDITERKRMENALRESEERFRALFNQATAGIAQSDQAARLIFVNPKLCEMLGYSEPELIGKTIWDFTYDPDLEENRRLFEHMMASGEAYQFEKRFVHRNGSSLWTSVSVSAVHDQTGKPTGGVGVVLDITPRKQAEEALRAKELELQEIINQTPFMLTRCSRDLRYRFVSTAYARMIGSTPEDIAGKRIAEVMGEDGLQTISPYVEKVLQGEQVEYETEVPFQDIGTPSLHVIYTPDRDEQGNVIGWFASITDVTERKRSERALAEFARQQQALYQLSDRLHHTHSPEDVYSATLEAILNALQCDRASILLFDDRDVMRFAAWRGLSDAYRQATEGHSPWGPGEKNPYPICVGDVSASDLSDALKATIREEGIVSLAFIPLVSNGKLIGKFMVYYDTPHECSDNEIEIGLMIARQLASGIDRKRDEERLRESEERLRVTFDTAVVGFATLTPDARFVDVNDAFCKIVGYTREELLEMDCAALTHPFYIESTYEHVAQLVAGKIPSFVLEKLYIRKDGVEIWVQNSVSVVRRADGTPLHLIAITQDITERKQSEEKLRASETLYRTIARSIPGGGVYVVDKDFRYLVAEGPVTEVFGLSREQLEGQLVWEAFPGERGERMKDRLERTYKGEIVNFETEYSGRVYWTQQAPLHDSIGQAIIVTIDITERKRTEEALRQSEERFARFMQHLPGLAWIKDVEGRYIYANAAAEKAFGTPREQLYGRTDLEIFPSNVATHFKQNDELAVINEKGMQTVETLEQDDGVLHYSLVTKFPIPGPDGNPTMIGGTAFDITERKQAEEALAHERELLERLFETMPVMVSIYDPANQFPKFNAHFEKLLGWKMEEVSLASLMEVCYPDPEYRRYVAQTLAASAEGEWIDVRMQARDGRTLDTTWSNMRFSNGMNVGIGIDITERKRIEEVLRIENERFMRFVNSNIVGILIGDSSGKVILANDYYLRLLGVSRQDFVDGSVDWKKFTPPEWLLADERAVAQLRERGVCDPYEKEYIRADGTRIPVYIADAMLPGPGEEIAAFVLDITERKRAEEALRESEGRFSAILQQATAGIVRKDAEGRLIFVNEAYCNMLGYDESELLGKPFWQFTHPEDAAENNRLYDRMMTEGIPFKLEKRVTRRDGSMLWVDASVSPVLDAEGKPQSAVAVEVDITGRKQAEEALQQLNLQLESRVQKRTATIQAINQSLREEVAERKRIEEALRASEAIARASEEKLRTLFDLLPVGISFLDPQGQFLQMNSVLPNIVRLTKEQLLGQAYKSRKYIRPDGTPMLPAEFASARALRENQTIYNVETGIVLESGELIWTSVSAAPVDVEDVGVVVVTVDITEKKRAEQALQESHGRLRLLSQRLVEVQEEERRALARELHDRVGQTLAALNINLIIINGQLSSEAAQQIGARLNDSMKLVAETIALVRDVMTDLRPAVLDDYGLEAALESHLTGFKSRYNIQVVLEKPDHSIPRLGPSIEMTFLRIAQEALMNIARHAHAEHVNLFLRREGESICLTIRDDGIGIESWQDANRPGSHGLTIMRERAAAFGGTLQVKSVPGRGTTVEASIPYYKNENQGKSQEEQSL